VVPAWPEDALEPEEAVVVGALLAPDAFELPPQAARAIARVGIARTPMTT
jgi:hypothetical protein